MTVTQVETKKHDEQFNNIRITFDGDPDKMIGCIADKDADETTKVALYYAIDYILELEQQLEEAQKVEPLISATTVERAISETLDELCEPGDPKGALGVVWKVLLVLFAVLGFVSYFFVYFFTQCFRSPIFWLGSLSLFALYAKLYGVPFL